MSKNQYDNSARSVSDGDLAEAEEINFKDVENSEKFYKSRDKQVFFTLPRWMSTRRKSKSKIKYVKVDVPFNSEKDRIQESNITPTAGKRNSKFISKLFRRNSVFSSSSSSKGSSNRYASKIPISHLISASNTDIRCSNPVNFQFFDYHEYFKDKIPAICGIRNHGNTCFMNAVIQCLSNTDIFAEYFVMGHYKMDFLRRNKVHSKKYGTRGEVTEQLGALLKSLWSCQYSQNVSNKFKTLVAKYGVQYEGNDQHDAQEFLLWLLDKVHEDLNTAPKQKYKKPKGGFGRTDEDIAAEMLANHLRCNNSFVHDLFQGQFRSSLCCLGCGRFSNTFDPYLCVSLPVPLHQTMPIYLYLVLLKERVKMIKIGLSVDSQATVSDIRDKLSSNFGSPRKDLLFTEIIRGEFHRTFCDSDLVSSFNDSKDLYAVETPFLKPDCNIEREKIALVIVSRVKVNETQHKMFWRPFSIEVFREISYTDLKMQIFAALAPAIEGDLDVESKDIFKLHVVDGEPALEVVSSSVDLPLYMPVIDQALIMCDDRGPKHLKLYLQWHEKFKKVLKKEAFIDEHPSVASLLNSKKNSNEVSLHECFDLYFNEEKLGMEDAWMCPCCHHRLPSVKQLSLWTVPDIFIIHLKRFRQSSCQRTKVTTFVEFPYSGLDMNPYIAPRNNSIQHVQIGSLNSLALWSPWKRSRTRPCARWEDNIYDLYAVCNHHGSMQGGHYTAYCKNPVDGRWYLFDDMKVQEVQANDVISSDAYILFYQRSNLNVHSCASSASSGYSSASSTYSVGPDHWAFRMPFFLREVPMTSKSQDNLYDVGNTSSLDRRMNSSHRPFTRASKAYSTMLPLSNVKKSSISQMNAYEQHSHESIQDQRNEINEIPPPPPPPSKHYWTVTSV